MSSTTAEPGLGARLTRLVVRPRTLFEQLRARPVWFDALALTTVVAVLAAAATPESALLEQVEGAVSRRGEPVEITSEPAEIIRWNRYLAMMGALIGQPLLVLGTAGLLTLVFGVLGGGRASFRQHLAVTSHAWIISSLAVLIALGAGLALGVPGGLFAAADRAGLAGYLLASLNPLRIWMLALLALGVATVNQRWRWPSAAAVVFGVYLLLLLATSALN